MSKKILSFLVLTQLSVFANRVMPEVSKDMKTRNSSSMAVANERRSYLDVATFGYDAEIEGVDDLDSSDFDINGAFANRWLSVEFGYSENASFGETEPILTEVGYRREATLLLGFRPIDMFSFGLGYRNLENDSNLGNKKNFNRYEVEASTTFNYERIVFGGAYKYVKPRSDQHGYYSDITFGTGYLDEVLSFEAGISFKTKSLELSRGDRMEFFIGGTRRFHNMEFDTDLEYEYGDGGYESGDYNRYDFSFDFEYLITKFIYLTPGFRLQKIELNNSEVSSQLLSFDFGYREDGLEVTFGFEKLISGDIIISGNSNDIDLFKFTVDAGYSF
ncbi:hypothetical protein [Halobacteriovorax sp.]|uniref:hypothetical protein n=1 Tax=Halobacteriovorax sp. TaxID=2020862 RepID=UPI003AF26FE7